MKNFIDKNYEETLQIIRDLCRIPAPSGKEEKRAQFCLEWLKKNGAEGAYIDDALNVVFPHNCDGSNEITVFVAHTDTVFPDTDPMPFSEDEDKMYSPGVGDDTASVAVLMTMAKYLMSKNIVPENGFLIVLNSCEEGLGNLKGTRQIMKDYNGRVKQFVSFDSFSLERIHKTCVGSHRYEVEVNCEGGHSFGKFGAKNAIAELSKIITEIYSIEVPKIGDSKTTYNVGTIVGGTSVNTISQSAKMLCEYRSDNSECLDIMKKRFEEIFSKAKSNDVQVSVKTVGERPCEKGVDVQKKDALSNLCKKIAEEVTGKTAVFDSASTDCNIPLSMGIPAICIGVFCGYGAHTREEWIDKKSLRKGLEIGLKTASELAE